MRILFLIHHGFSESSGISKKIQYQIKGLRELGHEVNVCTYLIENNQHRVRKIDNQIIEDFGIGKWGAFKKRICYNHICQYVIAHKVDLIYMRSFHNANPFMVNTFRKIKQAGIKTIMEIPTYPYDQEYKGFPLLTRFNIQIDKLFRKQLARQIDAIVTFSNFSRIFGQQTIQISNGIDFDAIPLRESTKETANELHLIGVAEVHYWHGYDRIIHGIGLYNQTPHKTDVYFHIIGGIGPSEMYNSLHAPGFQELIQKYDIKKNIIFHGQKFGEELDILFNNMNFAIGSLGRHRSYIQSIKTLKNREYAARGIPFIYSEKDDDFENMPYILKAPADETPIDIGKIIDFYDKIKIKPEEIRHSIQHLSWKEQMKKVITRYEQTIIE